VPLFCGIGHPKEIKLSFKLADIVSRLGKLFFGFTPIQPVITNY